MKYALSNVNYFGDIIFWAGDRWATDWHKAVLYTDEERENKTVYIPEELGCWMSVPCRS